MAITRNPGIYQWRSIVDGNLYIGSAVNLRNRKSGHLQKLRLKEHANRKFQRAFSCHGEENFIFEILEEVLKLKNESKKDFKIRLVLNREQYYLDTLLHAHLFDGVFEEKGYNLCRKADSSLGTTRDEEFSRLQSIRKKGCSVWNKGISPSEETLEKMRKPKTEEHKKNNSIAQQNRPPDSEETRKKKSDSHKDLKYSESHCKAISDSLQNHIVTKETRKKLSLSREGKIPWNKGKSTGPLLKESIEKRTATQKLNREIIQQEKLTMIF